MGEMAPFFSPRRKERKVEIKVTADGGKKTWFLLGIFRRVLGALG